MRLDEALEAIRNGTKTSINLVNDHIGNAGAKAIAEALKKNCTITSINLSRNNIDDTGAAAIADALKTNQTLTSINLAGNRFGNAGATAIANALKTNQTLTSINLDGIVFFGCSKISNAGAKAIAEALKKNHTITSINLSYNDIDDAGAAAVADALKTNQTLTSINLAGNRLGKAGVAVIAEILVVNQTLTSINLNGNNISDVEAEDIAEALKINKILTSIDLCHNEISNVGAQSIVNMFEENKTLTSIGLDGNKIGDVGTSIRKLLKRNKFHQISKNQQQGNRREKALYSAIDSSRPILDNVWVISLVRKPDDVHAEHAFLILEGKQGNRSKIWFMDFIGKSVLPGMGDGRIRIHADEGNLNEELLFCCNSRMMDIRRGDRLLYASWNISSDKGKQLITAVTQAKSKPPKFNILGQQSLLAIGTGASSSKATGHNCFTWAKEQLRNLNDSHIQLPAHDIRSWIVSATSRLLVDRGQQATFWYQRPVAVAAMVGTAAAVGGLVVANSESLLDICKF